MVGSLRAALESSEPGRELLFQLRRLAGRLPRPDPEFPQLVNIETASVCNLSCIHCPPQQKDRSDQTRRLGVMELELFHKLMDEVDAAGPRRISLHKDGEPLLHPRIDEILARVKRVRGHEVYLTTNGNRLGEELARLVLNSGVDIVNFSLGAASPEFYAKVRGKGFLEVQENVERFLRLRSASPWKPRVIAQIIDLPEYPEMPAEIEAFRRHWGSRGLEVQVWGKLNWGVYDNEIRHRRRWPCYSLWESCTVNSDGLVSACCMDWRQELLVGDARASSLRDIWRGEALHALRLAHIEGRESELPLCAACNYWNWQPRLARYRA